ncbi:MAG TPA: hypothetical protein VG347_04230 [Verrucomicrobiae bacterium]|nr:hypothetical protein [Verrucomicrobiae bacterium]
MPDEVPPIETPTPVPANTPPPENLPAPPASKLVLEGDVRGEHPPAPAPAPAPDPREARLRDEETRIAERERKLQEREDALRNAPVKKEKRKRHWSDPVFGNEEDEA